VVGRSLGRKGFTPLPKRWTLQRTYESNAPGPALTHGAAPGRGQAAVDVSAGPRMVVSYRVPSGRRAVTMLRPMSNSIVQPAS
jgi:hypothetical protein